MIYGESILHPVALTATLSGGITMLMVPRRYVIVPLLIVGIFIPMQQRVVIGGLDFMMIRILVLFGWIRILFRSELASIELNMVDKVLIWWAIARIVTYTILWHNFGAFINRLGVSFDSIGIYFLARSLIRDFDDFILTIKTFAIICLCLAFIMQIERISGRNWFSIFGGVPAFTHFREGRLRCQGAFAHSILAGTFGATLIPLFWAFWHQNKTTKLLALIGGIAATVITINSSSSGPVISYLASITGIGFWKFRRHMRRIRWIILIVLIGLHLSMKAPVWALIGRAGVVGGSTAHHRYKLLDEFINRLSEWWILGIKYTSHWHKSINLMDVTNYYVRMGVDGGLITLVLFLTIIVSCFKSVGIALHRVEGDRAKQLYLWALGASMFSHVVSFMGVSYFDQIIVLWYITLAMIAASYDLFCIKSRS